MIIITGPHGAGKTTIAKMLARYNFDYLDLGGILRQKHKKECLDKNFEDWCLENEKIFGKNFTDDIVIENIKKRIIKIKSNPFIQDIIIVGSRSLKGIEYIIRKIPPPNKYPVILIYVDAPFNTLMKRYCARENQKLSIENFKILLDKDNKNGLIDIISHADIKITNNGSLFKLRKSIKYIIFNNLKYSDNKNV